MTCNDIENRLPAYLEDLLSPEEKKSIEGHIFSCPRCSRAIVDLKKAENLLQGLGEVEPPPYFEQRIMSRVREEAGKKQGFLRRLFYPLHIKIPIQVLATILVAVLAFYINQKGEPEMKKLAPFPSIQTEQGEDKVAAETPKTLVAPPATTRTKQAPAGDLPEKNRQRFMASPFEIGREADEIADPRKPVGDDPSSPMQSAAPIMAAKEKEIPRIQADMPGKAQDRAGTQEADKSLETILPEQKRKMTYSASTAGESKKPMSAPVPSRLKAAGAIKEPALDLTIQVKVLSVAIREVEERLDQANARITERQHSEEREFIKAEVAARNVDVFLDRLEAIGVVNRRKDLLAVPDGNVAINIEIVSHP